MPVGAGFDCEEGVWGGGEGAVVVWAGFYCDD